MVTVLLRRLEIVLACVVLVYGVRTAIPLTTAALPTPLWWRIVFGLLVLVPGILLLARSPSPSRRRKTLLGVAAANIYVTAAILGNDWTRLSSAACTFGMSIIAFILYAGARAEGRTRE